MRRGLVIVVVAGCAAQPVAPRFANQPPVMVVDDRRDVPKQPAKREFLQDYDFYENSVDHPIKRAFELPRHRRALGVNAIDEVPDSTWFTNRVGLHDLTPDQVRQGPLVTDSPELHEPWHVKSDTAGASTVRFVVEDGTGARYIVKFDPRDRPEIESGTHMVVNRLLWAAGYNVPEDRIIYVRPDDFVVAPGAKLVDREGEKIRDLDRDRLLHDLSLVARERDGTFRALVSRYVDGKPLGGHPATGVRPDDPNDRIPHDRRRDLRGASAIFAWLDHLDIMEGNFVDTWIKDGDRHYVLHYLVDFGKSLGVMALASRDARRGHAHEVDFGGMLWGFVNAGLAPRSWDGRSAPELVGVSPLFDARTFDPGEWASDQPYMPFEEADRFDKFWGAKIVARFTPAQIRAAVDAARFSDPRAADYVTRMLVDRQRATAAYWFARVNPLDGFRVDGARLCFTDLAIEHGLATAADTRYAIDIHDRSDHHRGRLADVAPAPTGSACTPLPPLADAGDGYTILRVATTRPGFTGTTAVHVARDPAGAPRVIGLWRE